MKFSIVTPVYNSSQYLDRCVQSIQAQTYDNWELILVDDGSKDNSWEIIEKYVAEDKRIKGYHQENAGPGAARNNGIEKTTGDYLLFVDSDDYIDKNYLSLLKPKAEKNDVVYIDFLQVDSNGTVLNVEKMSQYKEIEKNILVRSQLTGKILWGGPRKAVNLKLIRTNKIQYSSSSVGEENLYSFQVLNAAKSFTFLDEKPVYMYVNHPGSQSKRVNANPYKKVLEEIREYIKCIGEYDKYADTLNAFNVEATVVSIYMITLIYKGLERKQKLKERIKEFDESYDHNYKIDTKNLVLRAKIFIPFLKLGWTWPVVLCSQLRIIAKKKFRSNC